MSKLRPVATVLCFLALCSIGLTTSAFAQNYTESVIYSFGSEGSHPFVGIAQGSDGKFYGVAYRGGANSNPQVGGVAFSLTMDGGYTALHNFPASATDGSLPEGLMIQGTDGNYYGTTSEGGANDEANHGDGTIFKLTPSGKLTILHSFNASSATDAGTPVAGLIQGTDGNFYGTASEGGPAGGGAVFKITPSGTFSVLHSFTYGATTDGFAPFGGLVQGSDGNFYGATTGGGANGCGTIFKITPSGSLTLLHSFAASEGAQPSASLVEGSDGAFYGTAVSGGSANLYGSIFRITSSGTFSVLLSFTGSATDGGNSYAPLFPGSDGEFYGTAYSGGADNAGTFFKVTSGGKFSLIHSFAGGADGSLPNGGPLQGDDGNFYGTTDGGGASASGTVYEVTVSPALAPPVELTAPASVNPGASFTLSYKVANAYSATLGYCFAANSAGNSVWTGLITGKPSTQTKTLTASETAGTYTYSLTCGGMETGILTLKVGASKVASTTTLTASPTSASVGQPVTLKATVTGSGASPTGSIGYSVEGIAFGTASLNGSGVASFSASSNGIAPGSYPVVASYAGNSSYNSSASKAVTVTVSKAPTTTTLTASPTSVTPPTDVTLTATVKRTATGAKGIPTGAVTFSVGSFALATVQVNGSGVAVLTASSKGQAAGGYPVTAKYNGDTSDSSSSSSVVTVTVK
jgi:uncharacterized repeat protein (TIGR03803 family)